MKKSAFLFIAIAALGVHVSPASADAKVKPAKVRKEATNTEKFAAEYQKRLAREGSHRDQDCSCRGHANCSCSPSFNNGYDYGYGYGYGYGFGGFGGFGGGGGPGWSRSGWGGSDIPTTGYAPPVSR